MGPGVITSRTLASMMCRASSVSRMHTSISALPEVAQLKLRPAEQAVEGAADFLGQPGVGVPRGRAGRAVRRRRDQCCLGLADQAAVQAFDLAEPPDQVHAGAPGAGLELGGPLARLLARRADQDKLVTQHAPAPGALPPLRVRLPHAAPVTRQSPRPPRTATLAERGERLRVLGA